MTKLHAPGFPADEVRARARSGPAEAFPPEGEYGRTLYGAAGRPPGDPDDLIDAARLVPPVFMPRRLARLIELGREPSYADVLLATTVGGLRSPMPLYVSAFGSTRVASGDLGIAVSRQAGRLGLPMVIGENVLPTNGYRASAAEEQPLLARIHAYADEVPDGLGGVVIQQSTEDADAEVWNKIYSDPAAQALLDTGRLGFELKVGQGAKPGLGGMTLLEPDVAADLAEQYAMHAGLGGGRILRGSAPGTFTEEILRQQVRLMRNNFPRAKTWVKLHPGRDVRAAAGVAWESGAHAVTVDGAEGGTGWAPRAAIDHLGLPLGECLRRIGRPAGCLLATGRMWEGSRVVKALAMGATAAGLGRAALLAADEDPRDGLVRFVGCLELEIRLLVSALGKYDPAELDDADVFVAAAAGAMSRP